MIFRIALMKNLSETSIALIGDITDDWLGNILLNQKTAKQWADSINQKYEKLTDVYVVSLAPKFAKQLSQELSELGLQPNVHVLKQNSKITNLTAINGGKKLVGGVLRIREVKRLIRNFKLR